MKVTYKKLDEISREYGEAFYILDTERFESNFLELRNAFRAYYENTQIAYSYKTNYTPRLCSIVDKLGGFAEVVSDMEGQIALKLGVKYNKIYFNGPYKDKKFMEELLLNDGIVNIDSNYDFEIVKDVAKRNKNKSLEIGIRCNFDVGDGVLSRFGFDVTNDDFMKMINELREVENINIVGLHCHFAQRSVENWPSRAKGMLELVDKYFEVPPKFISLGGGIFGKMSDSLKKQFDSEIPSYEDYAKAVGPLFNEYFKNCEDKPILIIEPGSALVGDAMKFASKVMSIKDVRGKKIATVLGSIYNINPTLNKKNPPITVFTEDTNRQDFYEDLDFGGFTCIESDYLYRNYEGNLKVGDYALFDNVGSYSVVLKPPFILPNFAMVEIKENSVTVVKEKESFDDLFKTFKFD